MEPNGASRKKEHHCGHLILVAKEKSRLVQLRGGMPSLALRLLRKRMREAEDAEANRKRRLLSVADAGGAYVALVLLTYMLKPPSASAHLTRAVDSSWTTLVRTRDDMAYLEYTALTVGAFERETPMHASAPALQFALAQP